MCPEVIIKIWNVNFVFFSSVHQKENNRKRDPDVFEDMVSTIVWVEVFIRRLLFSMGSSGKVSPLSTSQWQWNTVGRLSFHLYPSTEALWMSLRFSAKDQSESWRLYFFVFALIFCDGSKWKRKYYCPLEVQEDGRKFTGCVSVSESVKTKGLNFKIFI